MPQISGGRPYLDYDQREDYRSQDYGRRGEDYGSDDYRSDDYRSDDYDSDDYDSDDYDSEVDGPGGEPGPAPEPLTGPVRIAERAVIGDQLRIPIAWCQMRPCVASLTDPDALGEADIRERAVAAGWRYDAFGRLACPACQQRLPFWSTRQLWPWSYPAAIGRAPAEASEPMAVRVARRRPGEAATGAGAAAPRRAASRGGVGGLQGAVPGGGLAPVPMTGNVPSGTRTPIARRTVPPAAGVAASGRDVTPLSGLPHADQDAASGVGRHRRTFAGGRSAGG